MFEFELKLAEPRREDLQVTRPAGGGMPAVPAHGASERVRNATLVFGFAFLLSACNGANLGPGLDFRSPPPAAKLETAPRPEPDARGVISYPSYQVVVARGGETVADVARRIDLEPRELARYNGLPENYRLRAGEILALPRRLEVVGHAGAPGGIESAPLESDPVTSIAAAAIADAEGQSGSGAGAAPGTPVREGDLGDARIEPIRHKVERGETVYTLSRLYGVPVKAIAEWNNLGPDLTIRTGQYVVIPVPQTSATAPSPTISAGSGNTASASPPAATSAAVVTAPQGRFLRPVEGRIVKPFKPGSGGNPGIDIAAAPGTPVKAAADGTVTLVSKAVDGSRIVLLRHGPSLYSVYANLGEVSVKKGDKVRQGEIIGKVADKNPSTLHFEIRKGTTPVDPADWIG